MKTIKTISTLILILTTFTSFAQELTVNKDKSTISWIGKKIGGQHEGFIKIKSGSLELKDNEITTGNFIIDMNSITCTDLKVEGYNQKLIGHLKSEDFFGVEEFPTAIFEITKAAKFSKGKATVTGKLTIKGKTEEISFDLNKHKNSYSAVINVDRSKFDVKYGSTSFFKSLGDKAIDDIFTLTINLVVD